MAENLKRKKSVTQASFTRTFNSLEKLLSTESPATAVKKVLDELEQRFHNLEIACEAIQLLGEIDGDLETLLAEQYDKLNDMHGRVSIRIESSPSSKATSGGASEHEDTNTGELIKSFKASLTLPKPDFKKFNGNSSDYAEFISYIETYVEPNVKDSKQCLTLLIDTCTGMARDAVAYFVQSSNADEAYERAKTTLKELFGRKRQIIRAVLDECTSGPTIKPNDFDQMKRLVINMKRAQVTLEECGSSEELVGTESLVKIYHKLPKPVQNKWNDKVFGLQEKDEKPSFEHMCKLIDSFIKSKDNEYSNLGTSTSFGTSTNFGASTSSANSNKFRGGNKPIFTVGSSEVECILCQGRHYLNQCPVFLQLNLKSKYDFVSQKQLCRNCFHSGHIASKCKRKGLCKQCSGKHNNVLHDPNFRRSNPSRVHNEENNDANTILSVTKNDVANATAGIACVEILVEGSDALYKCKAIVDQKSSVNLCSQRLANKLKLSSSPFQTTFNVATGNYVVKGNKIHSTKVYSNDMQEYVMVNDLLTVETIPLSMNSIFSQSDIDGLDHLKGVKIPKCSSADEIDVLIGSGVPKAFHQHEQRVGHDREIYAVRLTLGWDLVGPKCMQSKSQSHGSSLYSNGNIFLIDNSQPTCCMPLNDLETVFCQDFKDCSLFSSKVGPSIEDERALSLVSDSMVLKDGTFCVGIPWKQDPKNLPSNKKIVLKRLNGLKRRFENDAKLFNAYSNEIEKFIDSRFIELSDSNSELCHYIPHHPVWHPRKGSLRVVWDCAASLNDFIYEGPDLLTPLTDVLIRFRRFRHAITSDIRKMYLNVKVPVHDRGALRILWWPQNDLSKDPIEYRAAVHIYGAKSSGFIANYCIRTLAEKVEDPVLSDVLKKVLYVDDQASSVQHENQAKMLVDGLSNVLNKGGFHLTKFVSSSPVVMESIPESDRGNFPNSSIGQYQNEHSVLGLKWNFKIDEIGFHCSIPNSQVPTRRSLLSAVAQMYDPLGVVSPTTLPAKVILQQSSSLGWDEPNPDVSECYKDFCSTLQLVSEFTIPRCYKPKSIQFDDPSHISLHGFSDASNCGYSAVVYIRQVSSNGQVIVSFVLGKSCVAPKFKGRIPVATVPKLELNAAALLAKLVDKVKGCIDIPIDETFYWCDSQAVLSCISATDKRFPVYWSNRLALILGLSSVQQWRYVPTKCNPADVGSRGIKSKDFAKQMRFWISGPSFLMLSSEKWPEVSPCQNLEEAILLTEIVDVKVVEKDSILLEKLINHYSKLPKLLSVVESLLHFMVSINPASVSKQTVLTLPLDNAQVMKSLIRFEQRLLVITNLKKLKPFQDEHGIYRIQGRLSNMKHLTYDERCPIILPKKIQSYKAYYSRRACKFCSHGSQPRFSSTSIKILVDWWQRYHKKGHG